LCSRLGNEFAVLLDVPVEELAKHTTARVTDGLRRVREGLVEIKPGFDGTYGEIHIFGEGAEPAGGETLKKEAQPAQTSLF